MARQTRQSAQNAQTKSDRRRKHTHKNRCTLAQARADFNRDKLIAGIKSFGCDDDYDGVVVPIKMVMNVD